MEWGAEGAGGLGEGVFVVVRGRTYPAALVGENQSMNEINWGNKKNKKNKTKCETLDERSG